MAEEIRVYPKDECNSDTNAVDTKPVTEVAKAIIDLVFDPLAGDVDKHGAYLKAGIKPMQTKVTVVEAYEIVNLDPDNPWDIFYRDDDPKIWQKNREANRLEYAANIQRISEEILEPIRKHIKYVYGDAVTIKVELCFMSKAAIIKYSLPESHLFSQGKALLMRIEGERASLIYDEIKDWCNDKNNLEEGDISVSTLELNPDDALPINYGMMKLCNTESEKQLIYITLPFTDEELEKDELLLENKSNFYYTECNDFRLAPEADTKTKIFPAYQQDNGVEDVYNKLDDMENDLKNLNEKIAKAMEDNNDTELENLRSEKKNIEIEIDFAKNPTNEPDSIREINKLEKINELYPTPVTINKLKSLNENLKRNPSLEDSLTEYINKINSNEIRLLDLEGNLEKGVKKNNNDIYVAGIPGKRCSNKKKKYEENKQKMFEEYFMALRMFALNVGIICMEQELIDHPVDTSIDEELVEKEYKFQVSNYETEVRYRKLQAYNNKVKELYPNGIPKDTNIPPIEISEEDVDISDLKYPDKDEIRNSMKVEIISKVDIVKDAYATKDLDKFYEINVTTKLNYVKLTDEEILNKKIFELSKYDSLNKLVDLYKKELELIKNNTEFNSIQDFDSLIVDNDLNNLFYFISKSKADINDVADFYFDFLKEKNKDVDNIEDKVNKSKSMFKLLSEEKVNITAVPMKATEDYAKFCMKYLKCEIDLYTQLNDEERLSKLNEIKSKLEDYYNAKEWNRFDIDSFKTNIFNFSEVEYITYRLKRIDTIRHDTVNSTLKDRQISDFLIYFSDYNSANMSNPYIELCSVIGMGSFYMQSSIKAIDFVLNNYNEYIASDKVINKDPLEEDVINNLNIIKNYMSNYITKLNSNIDCHNGVVDSFVYVDDDLISLDIKMNEFSRNLTFKDYGIEYIQLNEQIGSLKINKELPIEERNYQIELKHNRLICKRSLDYILLSDLEKKIQNYKDELETAAEYNKTDKINKINNEVMPELIKLKDLRDNFFENNTIDDGYESMKSAQTKRYEFLSDKYPRNSYLFYKKLTNDTTMDYEYGRGVFSKEVMSDENKYKTYVKELIKALESAIDKIPNTELIEDDLDALKYELAYIENKNNEKETRQKELMQEMRLKKIDVNLEIEKREKDKEYLHYITWKNSLEEMLKLKYKTYIRIENTPSKGIEFKYPFMLFDEYSDLYRTYKNDVSIYQLLDGYKEYTNMSYNVYAVEKDYYINKHIKLWENVSYEPNLNSVTDNINSFIIFINESDNEKIKRIYKCISIINGFMDITPILVSENKSNYSKAFLLNIRRTNLFVDDLTLLLKQMYDLDLSSIDIKIENKDDVV